MKNMTLSEAAAQVLAEAGEPLHYSEITKRVLERGLAESKSKMPEASMATVLFVNIRTHGAATRSPSSA